MNRLNARHAVTTGLIRPAYETLRSLHPRHRDAGRAYREGLVFRMATAKWETADKDAWILQQLRRQVRRSGHRLRVLDEPLR